MFKGISKKQRVTQQHGRGNEDMETDGTGLETNDEDDDDDENDVTIIVVNKVNNDTNVAHQGQTTNSIAQVPVGPGAEINANPNAATNTANLNATMQNVQNGIPTSISEMDTLTNYT